MVENFRLPSLCYLKIRFTLISQQECVLPSWKGSTLRGAFGHALKSTVCTMQRNQKCVDCLLKSQCAYTRLFETFVTEPPTRFLKGQISSPRPFILECRQSQTEFQPGDELVFNIILLGDIVQYMPYIVFSVYRMAQRGLGARRHPFRLREAYCQQFPDEWQKLYNGDSEQILFSPQPMLLQQNGTTDSVPKSTEIKFLTPTRIVYRNQLVSEFSFRQLTFKMLRRILELAHFYANPDEINWEFREMLVAADDIKITRRNLHWKDRDRYSNRQKTKLKMGGFTGSMTLEGDLSPFLDLLAYSEVVHVGKGATFGLGEIEMSL